MNPTAIPPFYWLMAVLSHFYPPILDFDSIQY